MAGGSPIVAQRQLEVQKRESMMKASSLQPARSSAASGTEGEERGRSGSVVRIRTATISSIAHTGLRSATMFIDPRSKPTHNVRCVDEWCCG
jgi:hypothetical protein